MRFPSTVRSLLLAALVLGNVVIILVLALNHRAAALRGWDCSYPLLVANEASGDRPWVGRIRGLAIYPKALSARDIERLADAPLSPDGLSLRHDAGAFALYSFAAVQDQRAPQLLQNGPRTDLLLPPAPSAWQVEGGALEIQSPTLIQSRGPARALCEAVMASQAFAVEVEVASAGIPQGGPARIVSYSSDPLHRNFTLGEEFGALVLRVRTPWTGLNGERLALQTEGPVLDDGWHHVVFGYARGAATLFLDGAQAVPPRRYYRLVRINDDPHHTIAVPLAAVVAPIFLAMGVAAGFVLPPRPGPGGLAAAYAITALVPIVAAVALSLWFGHDQDWLFLAAAIAGPAIGLAAGLRIRTARRGSRHA